MFTNEKHGKGERCMFYVCLTYIRHFFSQKGKEEKVIKKDLVEGHQKKKDSCNFALKRKENNEREYAHKNA